MTCGVAAFGYRVVGKGAAWSISWLWEVSWLRLTSGFWSVCVHGPVKGEGMWLLIAYMSLVWWYVLPYASIS